MIKLFIAAMLSFSVSAVAQDETETDTSSTSTVSDEAPESAEQTTTTNVVIEEYNEPAIAKGFALSLKKPFNDMRFRNKNSSGTTFTSDSEVNDEFGIGIGYNYIREDKFGFTVSANYLFMEPEGTDPDIEDAGDSDDLRFDQARAIANLTYGFNGYLYGLVGLHGSYFVDSDLHSDGRDFDWGGGGQAGLGFQISDNIGADVLYSYNTTPYSEDFNDISKDDATLILSGVEANLNVTF